MAVIFSFAIKSLAKDSVMHIKNNS